MPCGRGASGKRSAQPEAVEPARQVASSRARDQPGVTKGIAIGARTQATAQGGRAFIPIVETEIEQRFPPLGGCAGDGTRCRGGRIRLCLIPDHLTVFDPGQQPKGAGNRDDARGAGSRHGTEPRIGVLMAAKLAQPGTAGQDRGRHRWIAGARLILGLGGGRRRARTRCLRLPIRPAVSPLRGGAGDRDDPPARIGRLDYEAPSAGCAGASCAPARAAGPSARRS